MPTEIVLSRRVAVVKERLSAELVTLVEELVTAAATGASARSLELGTWKSLMELGRVQLLPDQRPNGVSASVGTAWMG